MTGHMRRISRQPDRRGATTRSPGTSLGYSLNFGVSIGSTKEMQMLYTIAVVLLVLWLLGLISGYAIGGVVHLLLVIAIILVVLQLFTGRRGI